VSTFLSWYNAARKFGGNRKNGMKKFGGNWKIKMKKFGGNQKFYIFAF